MFHGPDDVRHISFGQTDNKANLIFIYLFEHSTSCTSSVTAPVLCVPRLSQHQPIVALTCLIYFTVASCINEVEVICTTSQLKAKLSTFPVQHWLALMGGMQARNSAAWGGFVVKLLS